MNLDARLLKSVTTNVINPLKSTIESPYVIKDYSLHHLNLSTRFEAMNSIKNKGVYPMTIEIRSGTLDDFFTSAKETAKKIDDGNRIAPKHTIWMDAKDLMLLLKPERTALVKLFRKEKHIVFSHLIKS